MVHELKTWPVYFQAIVDRKKRFEIRFNDRNFKEGDTLILREFNPKQRHYTGRKVLVNVLYIFQEDHLELLASNLVVMSISDPLGLSGVRNQDNLE